MRMEKLGICETSLLRNSGPLSSVRAQRAVLLREGEGTKMLCSFASMC